jgi:hypothetical protein
MKVKSATLNDYAKEYPKTSGYLFAMMNLLFLQFILHPKVFLCLLTKWVKVQLIQ